MKKIISFCLVAILSLSFTLRAQAPPPENMPVDRSGEPGIKITFEIKQPAVYILNTSKICEIWASDNYDNHYQTKVGEYVPDYGFRAGFYSIPIFMPYIGDSTQDVYLTVTFRRVVDYHVSGYSNYFMYHHPDPIIYSGWDSVSNGSSEWYSEPEGSTKNRWDRYFVLKATWGDWFGKYSDIYRDRGIPVFSFN